MIGRTNTSGGGVGGAELVIVGGITSPAKANHNTIWIYTDVDITSYVLSSTEPENPVEGMAWVTIGDSGSVKMDSPVGGDWITVYPMSAKQYVNGAWVNVTAKSYQGGKWVDWWNGELFDSGNQYEFVTGGWVATNIRNINGGTPDTPTITITDVLSIYMKGDTSAGDRGSVTIKNNYIDLTPYTNLVVEITSTTTAEVGIVFSTIDTDGFWNQRVATLGLENKGIGTYRLDVSALNQKYYFRIYVNASTSGNASANIKKIYFE